MRTHESTHKSVLGVLAAGALVLAGAATAQVIERVSLTSAGNEISDSSGAASISADGRYVVFVSETDELVPDGMVCEDVYLHDRALDTTEQISLNMNGTQPDDCSYEPWVSPEGRYVLFASDATDLTPGVSEFQTNIYLRDRQLGINERISVAFDGGEADGPSGRPTGSADLSRVAFESIAGNLVADDTNGGQDIFVADRSAGTLVRVSVASDGSQAENDAGFMRSERPEISADGRFVVFDSSATNLVPDDTNGVIDVFVHDLETGETERVSVSSSGAQGVGGRSNSPSISADGRFVAFSSFATNLVPNDTNGTADLFVRDRLLGTTERVSVSSSGEEGNGASGGGWGVSLSDDGRVVVFSSSATNLVSAPTVAVLNVYLHDREAGLTRRLSENADGDEHDALTASLDGRAISANGDLVVFRTVASNLVPDDTNATQDVFVAEYPAVDLFVDKTSGAFYAEPGSTIEYTILVENRGVAPAITSWFVDQPPAELENVSWTCTDFIGGFCGGTSGTGAIESFFSLLPGGSLAYTMTGTVPTDWTDPITNTASATAAAGRLELNPADNSDSDTDLVGLFADGMESVES